MDKIDKRFVTDEFLLTYFPSPDRFLEFSSKPPISTLAVSEERYIIMKSSLNQERAKSGKPLLSDSDLVVMIRHLDGYLVLSKYLKPNQHL